MNAIVLVLACFTATDDPLIAKLDAEYQTLLKADPAATELRKAEKLLEATNQSSHWTNYMAATKIFRQVRSKTAIPLMLKYMIPHSEFGSTGSVDTYAETIFLLSGHDMGDPFSSAATGGRPAAVRATVENLLEDWWIPNKDRLTTDFGKWTRPQLEIYVDRFLQRTSKGRRTSPDNEAVNAYSLYHIIKYDLSRSIRPGERDWFDEELHSTMLPIFLTRAGYDPESTTGAGAKRSAVPFELIGLIAKMREDGTADQLDEIAADKKQTSAARLVCVLAMYTAGEDLAPEVLLSILEHERRLEPRLTAIMTLMLCRDAKLVAPTLIKLLDDPHVEIRGAAICAMFGSRPPEALPKLEKMLSDNRIGRYRSFLVDVIASYRNEESIRILGEFLQTALGDNRFERDVSDALDGLETASGMRWRSAGAHDAKYYRERSEEALQWWRLRRAAIARQSAASDHQHLLEDYAGPIVLPGELLTTYARFVASTKEPTADDLQKFCLPNSVTITSEPRSQKQQYYGQDLNLPFLQNDFTCKILNLRDGKGGTFLIRTGTSYLRFVNTASSGWKLYDYGDKPIR